MKFGNPILLGGFPNINRKKKKLLAQSKQSAELRCAKNLYIQHLGGWEDTNHKYRRSTFFGVDYSPITYAIINESFRQ